MNASTTPGAYSRDAKGVERVKCLQAHELMAVRRPGGTWIDPHGGEFTPAELEELDTFAEARSR